MNPAQVRAQRPLVTAQTTPGLRVLIADDHRTFAEVLAAGLGMERRFSAVDVAFSPSHARSLLNVYRHDLLLLDPSPDVGMWLELLRAVVAERPTLIVVVVSELEDVQQVIRVLAQDVRAWVSKDISLDGLLRTIDEAVMGRTSLPTKLLGPVLKELLGRPAKSQIKPSFINELTPRQLEVLQCLADGMSRAQIAEHLLLSPHTVRTHVQEVLRKAGVHSTLAALARAREVGY
ncbi:MAG: two component transcriptional regulator, LuxR family [Nocardioides sp.]|nr:two component transcriptional regulator, LuxR family [Nocardioides sp.]